MRNPTSTVSTPLRDVSTLDSTANPAQTFCLDIRRGRTAFHSRPIDTAEFLIGGSEECDLRLGGNDVPGLHSRIFRDGTTFRIEALTETSVLRINGTAVSQASLNAGDRIEIGVFEFILRAEMSSADAIADFPTETNFFDAGEEFDVGDLQNLSAAELVERIEQEQEFVEEFENRQQLGAMALLQTVRERMDHRTAGNSLAEEDVLLPIPMQTETVTDDPEEGLSEGLRQLLDQLTDLSQALENRSARLSRREAGYAEAVSLLLDAQDKLALQLEFVAGRISGMKDKPSDANSTRAIA